MERRDFLKGGVLAAGSTGFLGRADASEAKGSETKTSPRKPLKLKYSLQVGWFDDLPLLERFERMYAEGFRAVENNRLKRMPGETVESYGKKLRELGMEHGIFVANRGSNGGAGVVDPDQHPIFVEELKTAIEVAPLVDAKFMTVCTGNELPGVPREEQRRNVIEGLQKAVPLLEKADLVIVVEPLNVLVSHPGYFLARSDEAYDIMKAIGSPHVKILFDIYHQQITEGNLINNIRQYYDEIGYFQFADVPGRHEPWTGEINYRGVFKAIHDLGYKGFLGAELGPTKGKGTEGTLAVMEAIRKCDDWEGA